ncbi:MAG: MFS transporter [Capsulimonadaceae bacterium]
MTHVPSQSSQDGNTEGPTLDVDIPSRAGAEPGSSGKGATALLPDRPEPADDRGWLKAILPVVSIALCVELGTSILNNSTLPVYFNKGLRIGTDIGACIAIPFFISEVLFKSPMGVLTDRIGRKPLILFGCLMTVVTPQLLTLVPYVPGGHFAVACLFGYGFLRLLDGLGGAALWPALFAYVGDEVPERSRSRAMSLLNVMYLLALALSFYIGGKINDNFDSLLTGENTVSGQLRRIGHNMHAEVHNFGSHWRHHQGTLAIQSLDSDLLTEAMGRPHHYFPSIHLVSFLFVIASIICIVGVRGGRPKSAHHEEGKKVTWTEFVGALHQIPEYLGLAFVTFFGTGCIAQIVKIFAIDEFHLTEQRFGLLMLVPAAVISALAYPFGRLGDTWGKTRAVRLGFTLCALGLWGIPILHWMHERSEFAFIGSATVMGLGFVIAFPAWNALLTSICDDSLRGTVFGAVATAQGTGMLLGVLAGGWLYWHASHIAPFVTAASFVTISAVLALLIIREQKHLSVL